MNLYIGIDVGKLKLDFCGLNSDQQIVFQDETTNDINGAATIKKAILKATSESRFEHLMAGMEATSIYDFHPSMFLLNDPQLHQLGLSVVTINPQRSAQFSRFFNDGKTDKIDAFHLADLLRVEHKETPLMRQEKYVALQRLTRERYHLIDQITESKNHFLNNLYYRCNTLDSTVPTSVFGSTMMSIITGESLSLDDVVAMPLNDLATLLNKLSRGRFGHPDEIAQAIKKAVRSSYRLDKTISDSVDTILGVYAEELKALSQELKVLDMAIEKLSVVLPEIKILQSIPGFGPVYAAGILAEIGQIDRFKDESHIAKYAGLAWLPHESGSSIRQRTPHTHKGNQYLRYYLVEAANSVRRFDPTFQRYYQKKHDEVPKYQHHRACVLTARKLVRLVDVLLRNHQLYVAPKVA